MRETDLISSPSNKEFQEYKETTIKNLKNILDISQADESLPESFEVFLENTDHGIEHTYNVYKKALEIAEILENKTWENVDKDLLYIMAVMHDSWRFHLSDNKKKQEKCEKEHNKCWTAQIRLFQKKLKNKGVEFSQEKVKAIIDYIYNHDFFNERLDGKFLKEPNSLEWQIVRLADRISIDIREEIRRYRDTWKRKNTPLLKDSISFEDRTNFSFDKIWEYIKNWKLDQMFFFFTLLSICEKDFSHPVLSKLYKERAVEKNKAIDEILEIAKEEWYEIEKIKNLIDKYLEYWSIQL